MFLLWKAGLLPDEILIEGGEKNDLQTNLPAWPWSTQANPETEWFFMELFCRQLTTTGSTFSSPLLKLWWINNLTCHFYSLFVLELLFNVDKPIRGDWTILFLLFRCALTSCVVKMCTGPFKLKTHFRTLLPKRVEPKNSRQLLPDGESSQSNTSYAR